MVVVMDLELVYPEVRKVGDPLPLTEQASPKVVPQKIEFCSPKIQSVESKPPSRPTDENNILSTPKKSSATPSPPNLQRKHSSHLKVQKPSETPQTKRSPSPSSAFDDVLFSLNSRSTLPESPYQHRTRSPKPEPSSTPSKGEQKSPLPKVENNLPRILVQTDQTPEETLEFESSSIQTCSIGQLNPNHSRWMIQARVTYKSEIISWAQKRKQGHMFWVELLDCSGEIRATIWNDVPRLYSIFEVGKIYYVSRAKIIAKKGTWNSMQTENEMEMTETSVVRLCPASHSTAIPNFILNNCQISNLTKLVAGDRVDLIGIATYGDPLSQVISKKDQTVLSKRDIAVTDHTGTVRLTLWGDSAQNWVDSYPTVVLIKNVVVAQFKGHSLVFGKRSRIELNPQSEQTTQLLEWYDSQTSEQIQDLPFISWKPNSGLAQEPILEEPF